MCHYQTLYQDDQLGYVVRCPECEKIQIGFANLMLTFNTTDFNSFLRWVQRIRNEQDPQMNPLKRCIVIPTTNDGINLLLSLRELTEFETMLECADTELTSLDMISMFK